MNTTLKKALIVLILVFVLMGLIVGLTNAWEVLNKIRPDFFVLAAVLFLASILAWIISWAYLIKKDYFVTYPKLVVVGFSAVFGSLTPIQLGTEALRAIRLKEHFEIPYSYSVSASMVVKGMKFLIIAIFALIVSLSFLSELLSSGNMVFSTAFASGFIVILLAVLLFLLPLHSKAGLRIARFFHDFSARHAFFSKIGKFFENYSLYLTKISKQDFFIVFFVSLISFIFEFLALYFSFFALNLALPLIPALVLMVLISILERTPILPRGIGVIEFVGYYFLAFPIFAGSLFTVAAIGGVLIVYDLVRLVIPTLFSFLFNLLFRSNYF